LFPKIPTNPGVYTDDTPLEAEGYFVSTDKIRFVRGLPQSFAGWEAATSSTVTGLCRGIHAWLDLDSVKWVGMGTHTNLYGMTDSVLYDITPIASKGQLTNPFSTTNASTTVTVSHNAHGRQVGDGVRFTGATAVGGLTISGLYTVVTASTNSYTITAASPATSTAGPGGGTVTYTYYLAVGLASTIGAQGYSTGTYSSGLYSRVGTGDVFCRVWSVDHFGPNLIACPRNGKIYEWNPNTSPTQILQNPTFAAATGWTAGAGWTVTVSGAQSTLSSAALSQANLSVEAFSYNELELVISSYTSGTLTATYAGQTVLTAAAAGLHRAEFYGGTSQTSTLLSLNGTSLSCTVASATLTPCATASVMLNAPTQNTLVLVAPDTHVFALGTIEVATGLFNPMHIRWSDIAPNHHTWTPAATNQSRFWTLGIGTRIVGAKVSGREILIWTDKTLYVGTFTNNSNVVYNFRAVANAAGLIGQNAAAVLNGVAYWKSPNGVNYRYAGGVAEPMQSTVQRDVFDNIAFSQQDKIYAGTISQWQNVIWLYPDKRDGTNEVSRYELLCAQEPSARQGGGAISLGAWANGTFTRTAWLDASEGVFPNPIAVDSSGSVFYQERGNSANGGNINWKMRRGGIKLGDGRNLWMMGQFVPDFESLVGGCTLTPYSRLWMQSNPVAHGPFNITSATTTVDMLTDAPVGRVVELEFEGNASPCFMRDGYHCMDVQDTGMAF
jgi:hypothetical protein